MRTPGKRALMQTVHNASRKYPHREDERCRHQMLFPSFSPSFHIQPGSTVFTIGSCFARNIEDFLVEMGVDVPTKRFSAPHDEAPGLPGRILNQYNAGTMRKCAQDARMPDIDTLGLFEKANGNVVDLMLATGSREVTPTRAMERRRQIHEVYYTGLRDARVVLITLGLSEVWYDQEADLYLNESPPNDALRRSDRYLFCRLTPDQSYDLMAEAIQAMSAFGEKKNIVLTVSPVPMLSTYSGQDAVTANAYSKAALRICVDRIVQDFANVEYFPSYEMVTSMGLQAFGIDNTHVKQWVVEAVVSTMLHGYTNGVAPTFEQRQAEKAVT